MLSDNAAASSSIPRQGTVERLASMLRNAGWTVDVEPGGRGAYRPDLLIQRGPLRYVVQVEVAREARRAVIRAMFADAVLRARAYGVELSARPLAIIAAPSISPRVATEIREYADRFAPGIAWGFLGDNGTVALNGEGLDDVRPSPPVHAARLPHEMSRRRADPFSDLGQWLLKVLLAPRLEPKHLSAPRVAVRNASHLAEIASVSLPSAARHVAELRSLGFLNESPREVRLVRVGELLERWRATNAGRVEEVRARWLIPPKDGAAHLAQAMIRASRNGARACLGLFASVEKLGFHFVRGTPLHVYLEDVSIPALELLGLAPADDGHRSDLIVRRPRFPEAVFRAHVAIDEVPAADIVQCWLDVSNHPARGEELANQIWRRVLAPRLLEDSSP